MWRFCRVLPRAGHLGIFDRSYYGRVLVERVEGFCAEEEWRRAYREINELEAQQASFGMVIRKYWLHISREEQLRRVPGPGRAPLPAHTRASAGPGERRRRGAPRGPRGEK